MQIRIDVVAVKGSAASQPLGAVFDTSGGTIGRADSNKLILDDPDRTVSRVHAQIVFRNDDFVIVDRGSNAVQWNGQLLGSGNEAKLSAGDKLFIGSFELRVSLPVKAEAPLKVAELSSDDPFADLLEGLAPVQPAPQKAAAPQTPNKSALPDPFGPT
jgi:FHA domain-containing protein